MCSQFNPNSHDIGITNSSGTIVGMMLAQSRGLPLYAVFDDEALAAQFFTGRAGTSSVRPQQELILDQNDFRAGFGLNIFDYNEPKRYFSSTGMDLRHRGMGIPGPISTGIALPEAAVTMTITNGDMELNANWTGGAQSSTQKHGGTYSWKETTVTEVYQDAATWSDSWRNKTFAFTCWVWGDTAADVKIGINDGVTTTYSSTNSLLDTFESLTATKTLATNATRLRVILAVVTAGTHYFDDATLTASSSNATSGAIVAKTEFNDLLYMPCGDILVKLNTTGNGLTVVTPLPSKISALEVFTVSGVDYLFIALSKTTSSLLTADITDVATSMVVTTGQGANFPAVPFYLRLDQETVKVTAKSTDTFTITRAQLGTTGIAHYANTVVYDVYPYWYMNKSEVFTESNANNSTMQFFKTVHTTVDTLYGNDSPNTLRSTVNPLNSGTAWSAQTIVGASTLDITSLVERSGALYIMKEDMPYYLNSAGAVKNDLAPEAANLTCSTSGKNSLIWLDNLYVPAGDQSLLEIGDVNTWRDPSDYCTNLSAFVGRVQAVAADHKYLFAIVDNDTKVELLTGRLETIDAETSWVWHPIHELTLTGCETAFVSTIYQKRLWITSTSSSESLYYIPLTGYGNITADANRSFKTDTYFETSWLHGDFRGDNKGFYKITLFLGHSYDADIYYEGYYKKLEDSSYTSIGDFKGTATARYTTKYIPVDASASNPISTMMRFKFVAKTDSTTTAPILLGYDCRAILYPSMRSVIACTVKCGDAITNKQGLSENAYADTKSALDNLRTATWPISIRDIDGTTYTVKYLNLPSGTPYRMPVRYERDRVIEWQYNLLLLLVSLS